MGTMIASLKAIKFKYVGSWFRDQLSRPDWFHNLVASRTAWGAFSVYAHQRRSDGKDKVGYPTRDSATNAALDMGMKYGSKFVAYKCLFCDEWHVSKIAATSFTPAAQVAEQSLGEATTAIPCLPEGLDVGKILSTNIPDLAPVYGGFRGRTLSSAKQHYAWKPLVEAGIRQVIDLRADYTSDAYRERCEEFGIGYFHYPVVRGGKLESQMVELFPTFCELIDRGCFYIACAHGLHRTDIALCLYWVFYAADKGIAPPPIRGYREDKGLDTHKIMRALGAMYKYLTEKNGVEPIPVNVFRERRDTITRLSKE